MKLTYIRMRGFRGYRKEVAVRFSERFTIIDGRNGVGKSTIFDAVEYALTGHLSKYGDVKVGGESVSDYIWWVGSPPMFDERFVEVGFSDGSGEFKVRRTQFGEPNIAELERACGALCDVNLAPQSSVSRLCSSTIIRDEHIASLSLDLKEADRYDLLRDSLGANDADDWIERAASLVALAKRRVSAAQQEVTSAASELAAATRRVDEVRGSILSEAVIAEAVARIRTLIQTEAPADLLSGPAREKIAALSGEIDLLGSLIARWDDVAKTRSSLPSFREQVELATGVLEAAASVPDLKYAPGDGGLAGPAQQARDLVALVTLGRHIGITEGRCPLCATEQTEADFDHGTSIISAIAKRLDSFAAESAQHEAARQAAVEKLEMARRQLVDARQTVELAENALRSWDEQVSRMGFDKIADASPLIARRSALRIGSDQALKDIRVLDTLKFNGDLERALRSETDARVRVARAQERAGKARKGEATAHALHDAARRAASETLDQRLERVLPIMAEFYRRLRPHTFWRDIEYSIRGDLKRFLKLQVGDELNPQFIFSSGQRRATGLAFLLSVNISLAWNRWRSILLDDPVQHVDDFRTVHLAELLAQMVLDNRQVICAVEDAALADLLCRRLPIRKLGDANRISLGIDDEGATAVLIDQVLPPFVSNALSTPREQSQVG